jgi:putative methionine-R-sulfoxide reductase with GAF domain
MNKALERSLGLGGISEPQERELALTLYGIGISVCLTAAIGLVISMLAGFVIAPKLAGIGLVFSLLLLGLVRVGYYKLACALYPALALVAFTAFAYAGDGLYDELIFGFYVVIAMAGLLLRRRGVVIFTVLCMAAVFLLGYAHTAGQIPKYGLYFEPARVLLLCMMIALGGALMYFMINNLVAGIMRLSEKEQSLAASNQELMAIHASLETRVNERSRAAEAARADAEIARHEAEAQAWFARGQAQLAERMRGDQGLEALANNVTSYLCQYLGAHTGALFLVSGERLKLTGRHAYTESTERKREFRIGENLIGEAAKARKIMHVVNIPEDAMLISSALGSSKPNQVLIAPIEADGQVFGVVELATLNQFSAEHEAFLRRVSEGIAIALRTSQTRVQVDQLLAQSQRQAEELQAQEEELRAVNEELQAQAENQRMTGAARVHKRSKHE